METVMLDDAALRAAYEVLLDQARSVGAGGELEPPPGEWTAAEVLAHVTLVNAMTVAAVGSVMSGTVPAYDNRVTQDAWTIRRTIERVGGVEPLAARIGLQAEALCAVVSGLTEVELATPVPTVLVSHDTLLVDDVLQLRDLIDGLAGTELPGHTDQLRALGPHR
jgi:DinB superfamily